MKSPRFKRMNVSFASQETQCRAWFYHPADAGSEALPCIVMAHGLGGTRASGLAPFAERFVAEGYRVLVFDYRYFGDSGGKPRQLLTVANQLADWRAAIAFARCQGGVDPARIALWGTSFSGGHVTSIAARDHRIAAVVAQNPMMDGLASVGMFLGYAGLGNLLQLSALGLVDQLHGLIGKDPLLIPVVGRHGDFAALSSPEAWDGYQAIATSGWRNQMSARFALTLSLYRPITLAKQLRCPILVQACMEDSVVSPKAAVRVAELANKGELRRYEGMGHFAVYVGAGFETAVTDQIAFFRRTLGGTPSFRDNRDTDGR
ncbi:Serine aminopeptidase, S33 [Pseudomonas jinjuensis]|uniref:Serine aminopeptidase, S33 n=4 Tax=Pseudomonas jinjuensis TaxID=198616 RepID=A0A1H0EMX6_9PSED|nr:Serine aminopeptidase, S33 [Pseudomonas jinjuensis]